MFEFRTLKMRLFFLANDYVCGTERSGPEWSRPEGHPEEKLFLPSLQLVVYYILSFLKDGQNLVVLFK